MPLIDLSLEEVKMLEQRRDDMEFGIVNVTETKALLNRIYSKLGKEPRKRKPQQDLVALMIRNTRKRR